MKNKNQLIGCCGLDCEKCDARIATITDDNALREQTATLWSKLNGVTITPEMINCVGCRIEGVKTPFCDKLCPIHNCVRKNGLDTCADCSQMEGLRQELIPFAEKYVENTYYSFNENEFVAFEQRGKGTIDLALERPYLFRFLYTGERSQLLSNGFELQQDLSDGPNMYEKIADMLEITIEQAMDFAMTMMVYTQGMGTLIASGSVQDTKENMYCMLHNTGMTYLKGLGVGEDILQALSGGDESDADSSNG